MALVLVLSLCLACSLLHAAGPSDTSAPAPVTPAAVPSPAGPPPLAVQLKTAIQRHLGRPYVWGASGLKSFDCSGFVWRVFQECGIFFKRTTARKLYLCLPKADGSQTGEFGTLVFFDDLKHVGVVENAESFYHAQCSRGTNLSPFRPFWKPKVYGYRALPVTGTVNVTE